MTSSGHSTISIGGRDHLKMNGACSTAAAALWTPGVVPVVENDSVKCSPYKNNATGKNSFFSL